MTALPPLPRAAFLRQRWDRIGLGVRLAYNPWHPPVIRCYLEAGRHVVHAGALPEVQVQQRMLALLMQTADDPALPWSWRMACHAHLVFPLARLATLARRDTDAPGGADVRAWQQRADELGERLAQARPGVPAPGRDC